MATSNFWHNRADQHLRNRLRRFEHERDLLVERAHSVLTADARVAAAWLFGSLGRGDADELSDIDLFVITAGEHHDQIVEHRPAFMTQLGEPLLILEAPQNWPPGGVYNLALYPGEDGPTRWTGTGCATPPPPFRLKPSSCSTMSACPGWQRHPTSPTNLSPPPAGGGGDPGCQPVLGNVADHS